MINKPQEIQFERLVEGSFNGLDGEFVANSLRENCALWTGFVFGRFDYGALIELRDIGEGYLNADELMILTTKSKLKKLLKLIETWNADEVGSNYYDNKGNFVAEGTPEFRDEKDVFKSFGSRLDKTQVIVRVWWD